MRHDEDIRLLQLLGNHVALALSNIHLYNSLRRLNETGHPDPAEELPSKCSKG